MSDDGNRPEEPSGYVHISDGNDARVRLKELADHFLQSVSDVREAAMNGIDDIAIAPLLEAWATILEWSRGAALTSADLKSVLDAASDAVELHDKYGQLNGNLKASALAGIAGHLDVFPAIFDSLEAGSDSSEFRQYRVKIQRAQEDSSRLLAVMVYVTKRTARLDEAVAASEAAADAAKIALAETERTLTEGATSALERSFEKTAKANARAARWFRGFTIGVLVLAVLLGGWFIYTHPASDESIDWYGVVYRLAVLSGLAAIAAYLGRQASNYRRTATWAESIEIQLKAFLGFVNEIKDEEAKQKMFELFGKRVLEAPPDGKSNSDDSVTNIFQPMMEQASRLRS